MRILWMMILVIVPVALAAVDLQTGLIGKWGFDGDLRDGSTNGFHGTGLNSPGYRTGLVGQALSTTNESGTLRYANLGRSAALTNLTNNFTVAFWLYYNRTNGNTRTGLFTRMSGTSGNNVWNLDITETTSGTTLNGLRFAIYTNNSTSGPSATSTVSFPSNTWVHVACTLDGNTAVAYTNGATNLSFAVTGRMSMNNVADVIVGNRGDDSKYTMYGAIDEASLYNRALNHAEIQALRNGLSVSVTNATNGTTLFGSATLRGFHGAPLGGFLETQVLVTNASGVEVLRQTVSTDAAGNWSLTLPALASTSNYTAVLLTTNADGQTLTSAPIGFTWYASSNITLTFTSRNGAGTPWSGGRMVGPSSLSAYDGLRTNDANGSVTFSGLWSGRTMAVSNLTPEKWGQSLLITNLVVPDADGSVVWVFEGATNSGTSNAVVITNRGYYSGQGSAPFIMAMDLGRKSGSRVTIDAIPLSGGTRARLFDQVVSGLGAVNLEITPAKMKANLNPGIWVLEAKITMPGEDDVAAEKRRSLLFYYR